MHCMPANEQAKEPLRERGSFEKISIYFTILRPARQTKAMTENYQKTAEKSIASQIWQKLSLQSLLYFEKNVRDNTRRVDGERMHILWQFKIKRHLQLMSLASLKL